MLLYAFCTTLRDVVCVLHWLLSSLTNAVPFADNTVAFICIDLYCIVFSSVQRAVPRVTSWRSTPQCARNVQWAATVTWTAPRPAHPAPSDCPRPAQAVSTAHSVGLEATATTVISIQTYLQLTVYALRPPLPPSSVYRPTYSLQCRP